MKREGVIAPELRKRVRTYPDEHSATWSPRSKQPKNNKQNPAELPVVMMMRLGDTSTPYFSLYTCCTILFRKSSMPTALV